MEAYSLLKNVSKIMARMRDGTDGIDDALMSEVITKLQVARNNWVTSMTPYRTAKLWNMYMKLICILREFIRSSRSGDWTLYLQSLHAMLPYLAASAHKNYTKSLVLYMEKMDALEESHPAVYSKCMDGLIVLRRSDNYWAGIVSDLYIEQVLIMGSIKSMGGLTRGPQEGVGSKTRPVLCGYSPCPYVGKYTKLYRK